jgi:hypothetical protein
MSDEFDTRFDTVDPDPAFEAVVRAALDDPLPPDVFERSIALFELASIDAELAELLSEGAAEPELAGVRSTVTVTTFTFATGGLTIELEYDGAALEGQVFPLGEADVALINASGDRRRIATNSVGTFQAGSVLRGSWCLVVHTTDGAVRTPWFTL